MRGKELKAFSILILLLVSLTTALYVDNPKIIKLLIGKYRIHNPSELIRPNSEVVCKIRDNLFPNKNGNYTIRDSIPVLTYILTRIEYEFDWNTWGILEYYATPEETIKNGCGDCEDFAIITCSILRSMELDAWVVFGKEHAWVRIFSSNGFSQDLLGTAPPESLMFNEESMVSLD